MKRATIQKILLRKQDIIDKDYYYDDDDKRVENKFVYFLRNKSKYIVEQKASELLEKHLSNPGDRKDADLLS